RGIVRVHFFPLTVFVCPSVIVVRPGRSTTRPKQHVFVMNRIISEWRPPPNRWSVDNYLRPVIAIPLPLIAEGKEGEGEVAFVFISAKENGLLLNSIVSHC